ncbi:MAG TPA: hypothetical protein ENK54_06475 [Thiotrichales bacterium]|nr:hypothetical protein [Thiotrichales bacterium]
MLPLLLGLTLAATLAACGFHPRGMVRIPPQWTPLALESPRESNLLRDLRRSLESAGIPLAEGDRPPGAVLSIEERPLLRRVLSVGSDGRAREYELTLGVAVSLTSGDGESLMPRRLLRLRRDLTWDEGDVLGKAGEEAIIRQEMERDLARLILRQVEHTLREEKR